MRSSYSTRHKLQLEQLKGLEELEQQMLNQNRK